MKIDKSVYENKVRASWMGKAMGGGIGAPYEGVPYQLFLTAKDIYLDQGPNDDLELQLLWMLYAEKFGLELDSAALVDCWQQHIKYGMDEYGAALRNMRRGLNPPLSGAVDNWFTDGMGAAIRAEIWACLAPGRPEVAAYLASQDASVDHCGDGVWAEIFIAATCSAAFTGSSLRDVMAEGLKHIPADCRTAGGIKFVTELWNGHVPYSELRRRIMDRFGSHNFTDCVMEICFIVAAMLYGENDFEQTVLHAVNFGMDTDCTGATCGALFGILHGTEAFPDRLTREMNPEITVSEFLREIPGLPRSIDEFTARIITLSEKISLALENDPAKTFPAYRPVTYNPSELLPPASWLVMPGISENEALEIEKTLMVNGPGQTIYQEDRKIFYGTQLDLSPYVSCFNHMHLFSFVKIPETRDDTVTMACADTGITAWIDGRQMLNYHGRQPALPAFHRTEGGSTFAFPMTGCKYYLIHVRLLFCRSPLTLSVAVGNTDSQFVAGVEYKI